MSYTDTNLGGLLVGRPSTLPSTLANRQMWCLQLIKLIRNRNVPSHTYIHEIFVETYICNNMIRLHRKDIHIVLRTISLGRCMWRKSQFAIKYVLLNDTWNSDWNATTSQYNIWVRCYIVYPILNRSYPYTVYVHLPGLLVFGFVFVVESARSIKQYMNGRRTCITVSITVT